MEHAAAPAAVVAQPRRAAVRPALFVFTLTLLCSSTLLFIVEPMTGRLLLPRVGSTPAVWNTSLVFFQAVLLLGYAYAHLSARRLSRRMQRSEERRVGKEWRCGWM